MQAYWERRLDEARKINDQIEAELEGALAAVSPDAAEPVRAALGGGTASAMRRRYARTAGRTPIWAEHRRFGEAGEAVEILAPASGRQLKITIFPGVPAIAATEAAALPARRVVGPLWFRGLMATMYALASNVVLYIALVLSGAADRITAAESLPLSLAVTSILCAVTGTVAFGFLRSWLSWPDTAFRLLSAAALVALLVSFVITPGATVLGAIVAVLMTGMSLGSELVSD